jgi:hypothetical protein
MSNTLPNRAEIDFLRYEDFNREVLARKRVNVAPLLGELATDLSRITVNPMSLGFAEVSQPYAGELETAAPELDIAPTFEQIARPLGDKAINAANTTPNEAIRAQARTDFALAA